MRDLDDDQAPLPVIAPDTLAAVTGGFLAEHGGDLITLAPLALGYGFGRLMQRRNRIIGPPQG